MTITNSGGTSFSSTVDATTVTLSDTTGTLAFNGALTASTLSTVNKGYNVQLNAGGTITNTVTFSNTGTVTLGNDAADDLAFTGGLVATAPAAINLAGTVAATVGASTIALGDNNTPVSVTDNATVGGAATGAIGLGDVTLADGKQLTLGTGIGNALNLRSVLGNAGLGTETLLINTTGLVTVTGAVGATANKLDQLRITNSGGTTFSSTVDAATVTLSDTTGTLAFNGALTATTLNTANKGYNVQLNAGGTITNAVTFANTGGVTLGVGGGDVLVFGGGLISTASTTTINGMVRTSRGAVQLGAVSLTGNSSIDTTNAGASGATAGANIQISGAVDGTAANAQALTLNAGTGGVVTFSSGAVVGGGTALASFTVSGAVSASLRAVTTGAGGINITTSGSGATLHGDLTSGGSVSLSGDATLGSTVTLTHEGADSLSLSGGTLDTSGKTLIINTVAVATTGTISSQISGAGDLTKTGLGTLTVTGNNSYTGPTNVNQGTLLVNNVAGSATGSGAVNVNSGGTLGGTGTINGPVTIKINATLNPGPSGPAANTGLLTVSNNITFEAGSTFWVDVNATADYDQLRITGSGKTITIQSGALLGGTAGPGLPANASFTILDNQTLKGGRPNRISGTFASLGVPPPQTPPRTVNVGGKLFDTSLGTSKAGDFYNGGSGNNDLVLHPAPPVFIWDGRQDGSLNPTGDSLWTNRLNWIGDVAPSPGDKVLFDDRGISTNDPFNDFPNGTSFGEIRLANTTGSYTIAGNEILFASAAGALIQDNPTNVSVTNRVNFAFATATSTQVIIVEDGTLNFGGIVTLGTPSRSSRVTPYKAGT